MGENSKIVWTGNVLPDGTIEAGYTFNPWIGCVKISPACENCYAADLAHFHKWVKKWGGDYRRTVPSNWKKPLLWAKKARARGIVKKVFCLSLGDFFDKNIPQVWRDNLIDLIRLTGEIGGLEWLILTKRPENIPDMFPEEWLNNPPKFIRIGVTAENQEMAESRIHKLLDNWVGKNFISIEPMLSDIDFVKVAYSYKSFGADGFTLSGFMRMIDWVVCGCENGPRDTEIEWVRNLRDQCVESSVPFLLKQLKIDGQLVHNPELDGRQWLEFPETREVIL